MDHQAALESMGRFVDVLDRRFRDRYFIVDGTLLGFVRDGGFVDRDYDIDFGMWREDYDPGIVDDVLAAGFTLFRACGRPEDGLVLQFRDGDIRIDISFFHREGDRMWSAVYAGDCQLRAFYPLLDPVAATFLGIPVQVPSPPKRYLEAAYGADWPYPVTAWEYRYAPQHLKPVGSLFWRMEYAFKRARWRLRHGDIHIRPKAGEEGAT